MCYYCAWDVTLCTHITTKLDPGQNLKSCLPRGAHVWEIMISHIFARETLQCYTFFESLPVCMKQQNKRGPKSYRGPKETPPRGCGGRPFCFVDAEWLSRSVSIGRPWGLKARRETPALRRATFLGAGNDRAYGQGSLGRKGLRTGAAKVHPPIPAGFGRRWRCRINAA